MVLPKKIANETQELQITRQKQTLYFAVSYWSKTTECQLQERQLLAQIVSLKRKSIRVESDI